MRICFSSLKGNLSIIILNSYLLMLELWLLNMLTLKVLRD